MNTSTPEVAVTITYREGRVGDIAELVALNHAACDAYDGGNHVHGFLRHRCTAHDFKAFIEAGDSCVALVDGRIVGYYYTDGRSHATTDARRKVVDGCIANGTMPSGRYAYLTQACVDLNYQRLGIARAMLNLLRQQSRSRYDYLIGYIDDRNQPGQVAHSRSGWQVFAPHGDGMLAMIATSSK